MNIRVGIGYDVHRLADEEEFWLGGIKIPYERGAVGHSDADVLIHAICDALLGAANLGDIGVHFPDSDPAFKGIDSKILLKKVSGLLLLEGWVIVNIDSVISLQAPKIKSYIPEMKKTLAGVLDLKEEDVSVKATTTERLGFVGREEGIAARAVVLIRKG
jgi:2-C-methyl-D-erythritol 2,4-cyclodiphosphate synthase